MLLLKKHHLEMLLLKKHQRFNSHGQCYLTFWRWKCLYASNACYM